MPYLESLAPSTMTLALIQAPIIAHQSYSLGLLHQLSPWMQVDCRPPGMGQESLAPHAVPSLLLLPHHLLPCPLHSPQVPTPAPSPLSPRSGMRLPLEPYGNPAQALGPAGHQARPRPVVVSVSRSCWVAQTTCSSYVLRCGRDFISILSSE